MKRAMFRVLTAFLAGALVVFVVLELTRSEPESPGTRSSLSPEPPPARRSDRTQDLSELQAALQRIEERLDLIPMESSRPGESRRTAPGESPDESVALRLDALTREITALRTELEKLRANEADRIGRMDRARKEHPEADWSELQLILDLWLTDEESARKEVQLAGEDEIIRRFGSPDLMYPTQNGVRWIYGQGYDAERDAYDLQVVMGFADGYVSELFVEGI